MLSSTDISTTKPSKRSWLGRALLLLLKLTIVVVVLSLLLFGALQLPAVQTFVVKQTTTLLSKRLQTKVHIDKVKFVWLDQLDFKDIYIEDLNGDSLFVCEELSFNWDASPFSILSRQLNVDRLVIQDAGFYLRRDTMDYYDNVQQLIQHINPLDSIIHIGPAKTPFVLSIKRILLREVLFKKIDKNLGQVLAVNIPQAHLKIKGWNFSNKTLHFDNADFIKPEVAIKEAEYFDPVPIPLEPIYVLDSNIVNPDTFVFNIKADHFNIHRGQFDLDNYRNAPIKTTPANQLDFQHLRVSEVNAMMHDFYFNTDLYGGGKIEHLSLEENSGFVLNELSADSIWIDSKTTQLYNLQLKTPHSSLGDTLIFIYNEYTDFRAFPTKVNMDARFNDSRIAIKDIMVFAPILKNNTFFSKNRNKVVRLTGNIRGRVANLKGRNLRLNLADDTAIRGDFGIRNLTTEREGMLNLNLEQLNTSIATLRELIPGFDPPQNFDKLGKLKFNGRFDGFFSDFTANGFLRTDLGKAQMDMRMNLVGGRTKASYSGKLDLIDFNLKEWTGQKDLGFITVTSKVNDGQGLTGATASAALEAQLRSFDFKGYTYSSADLKGELNKNLFDGNFKIKDSNIDFSFDGTIDLQDSIPVFDFKSNVQKIDLLALNLSEQPYKLEGEVNLNLKNNTISDVEGDIQLGKVVITKDDTKYELDSVRIISKFDDNNNRLLQLKSSLADGTIQGKFELNQLIKAFKANFTKHHPEFGTRLNWASTMDSVLVPHRFGFALNIKDTKNFTHLIDDKLDTLKNITLVGGFDDMHDSLSIRLDVPHIKYNNLDFYDLHLQSDNENELGDLELIVKETIINDKTHFAPLRFNSFINKDSLSFDIAYDEGNDESFKQVVLVGKLFTVEDKHYEVNFESSSSSSLVLGKDEWTINPDNYIRFGKDFINTKNLRLQHNNKYIQLEDISQQGVALSLNNFDFGFIDTIWNDPKLDFSGNFKVMVEVGDVFHLSDMKAMLSSDSIFINEDYYGFIQVTASTQDIKSPITFDALMNKGKTKTTIKGLFNPPNYNKDIPLKRLPITEQPKYLDVAVNTNNFPLSFLQYLIPTGISDVEGTLRGNMNLSGHFPTPKISGKAIVNDVGVTIDYLQTRYFADEQAAVITEDKIDATGAYITDELGNRAALYGGLTHDHLRNLGLGVRIISDNFMVLNTTKDDNPVYYGTGVGKGDITFSGPFNKADIDIKAEARRGTEVSIPISYEQEASEVSFIRFVKKEKEDTLATKQASELLGLDIDMDLALTDEADIQLIFDEQAGDIVRGRGRGDIQLYIDRTGEMRMYGDYNITEGAYLFTFMNLVNKPFTVKPGGTIKWLGDPFGAKIDFVAEYEGLSTPVANLIQEYLGTANDDLKTAANASTPVDLTMQLQGDLTKPIIDFDIELPQLSGPLQSFTDAKLRSLRQDPNELNRQVFGLITFGQFLPIDGSYVNIGQLTFNTVGEFVSNQLSILLTEFFSEVVRDGGVFSDLDFDINYNYYDNQNFSTSDFNQVGNELTVRLKNKLFNDKVYFDIGGNIDLGGTNNTYQTNRSFLLDGAIEFVLNENKTVKLRLYYGQEPNIVDYRNKTSVGIGYRKEYDSLEQFLKSISFKKKKNDKASTRGASER